MNGAGGQSGRIGATFAKGTGFAFWQGDVKVRARPAATTRRRGFTLVEVLVALSIVAIALTAGLRATLSMTRNAERQSDVVLAQLCAENELVKVRLLRQMPGVGDTRVPCEQAGRQLTVALTVRPTPNPNFRKVDAQVFDADAPLLKISTVVGRF